MSASQEKRRCGKCDKDIRDIEPAQCSCCETFFHVQQECCDASRSSIQQLLSCHKALWLCVKCRKLFANRTLHDFLEERIRSHKRDKSWDGCEIDDLRNKVLELTKLVTVLQQQMNDYHSAVTSKLEQSQPIAWPGLSTASATTPPINGRRNRPKRPMKRRCGSNGEPVEVAEPIPTGTSDIDLSELQLSCPIAARVQPAKFWIYLSGFNPRITDDDVTKVVKRCLATDDDIEVHRLVPKDADVSRYTFISYKVGLDPALQQSALLLSNWPMCIKVREFINAPKNEPLLPGSRDPSLPKLADPDGVMDTDQ